MAADLRGNHKFAKALRKAMERRGWSQGDLAVNACVSHSTVHGWLSGTEPSNANFAVLVRLFPELAEFAR